MNAIEPPTEADEGPPQTPPPVDAKRKASAPAPAVPQPPRVSPTMRGIENDEERSLKDWLDAIGTQGAFKVQVTREKPTHVMVAGKQVETKGFLETYDHSLTEEDIQREHGGGTYHLKITRQNETGAYVYAKGMHRTIVVAGDPKTDRLPGNVPAPVTVSTQPPPGGETPSLTKMAFEAMQKQIDRQESASRGIDPAIQMVLDEMRRAAARNEAETVALRRELAEARTHKPEADPIKDKLLGTLLDGQSGHVEALRIRQEAELRQLKEAAYQDVKRIEDRHDRAMAEMRASHDRAMAEMRASHDREIHAMRSSHEIALGSAAAAHNIQVKILEATVVRLERDNGKLETEVAALREKKDKPLIEQIKDMNALKEAMGAEGEEGSPWSKIAELATNPEAIGAIGSIFRGSAPAAPPPPVQAVPVKPTIVRDRATGDKFLQKPDGTMVPVKKKPKIIVNEDGGQLQLPEVDQSAVTQIIAYMERAYAANQDAETVARSSRSMVPPEILAWIQEHDSEQQSGVDLFISKVAKLPGTSPLATQGGRNWIRKVGKALIIG